MSTPFKLNKKDWPGWMKNIYETYKQSHPIPRTYRKIKKAIKDPNLETITGMKPPKKKK